MTEEPDDYEGPWPREDAMSEWKRVPVGPTDEMIYAALDAKIGGKVLSCGEIYRAMLDAAPAAPVQQAEPVSEIASHGCHYLAFPDRICNKCGRIHGYSHPPAAEVQRLRDALDKLLTAADDSDDGCYGTLSTTFVRDIARRALGW